MCKIKRKNRGIQNGIKADLRNFQKYQLLCGLDSTVDQSDIHDSEDEEEVYIDGFDEFTEVANNVLIQERE